MDEWLIKLPARREEYEAALEEAASEMWGRYRVRIEELLDALRRSNT